MGTDGQFDRDDSIGEAATMRFGKREERIRVGDVILGRYRITGELGQGGMGIVYRCFDELGGIEVALKALPPEVSFNSGEMEEVRENFRLVEKLHHPNIAGIKTLERDQATGNYYLIMECINGFDLRQWARKRRGEGRPLTIEEVVVIAGYIASALDYAHEKKVIHRDIKPGNVRISFDGEVKVLDFGLAAQLHTSMNRVSRAYCGTSGTAPYMAPEQWRGKRQDHKTDQYSLAATIYELLAGAPPFESHDIAVLREAVLNELPEPLPGIQDHINAALQRALSKEQSDRFGSCGEFIKALSKPEKTHFYDQPKRPEREPQTVAAVGSQAGRSDNKTADRTVVSNQSPVTKKSDKWVAPVLVMVVLAVIGSFWMYSTIQKNREREAARIRWEADRERERQVEQARQEELRKKAESELNSFLATKESDAGNLARAELLAKHGGERWQEVLRQQRIGAASSNDPVEGARAYKAALAALPAAIQEAKTARQAAIERTRQGQIAAALATARQAKADGKWADCLAKAEEALQLDGRNNEATALKTEAERNLIPTLTINVVDEAGRALDASVSDGKNEWRGGTAIALVAGQIYNFTISASASPRGYESVSLRLTADWRGALTRRVALKEARVPMEGGNARIDDLGLELIWVASNSFDMGSNIGDSDERPVRRVEISRGYWLGKYEVTQGQWRAIMGDNPSYFKGDTLPVEMVSWDQCVEFCNRLTDRERRAGRLPAGYVYRLPTEAEWEFAARGGVKSRGQTYSGSDNLDTVAWYRYNSGSKTHVVGSKAPNELGLYDMSGNVWEWCYDWYKDSYSGLANRDPSGPRTGSGRVIRGGSWLNAATYCRVAFRFNTSPSDACSNLGFRASLAPPVQ